jgi:membrane protease YdiL (CAAX protease family)
VPACITPLRQALLDGNGGLGHAVLWAVLVVIPLGTVLPEELATVGFTTLAGVVLCWLRPRSDSLVAPILAHWAVNALGVIVTLVS